MWQQWYEQSSLSGPVDRQLLDAAIAGLCALPKALALPDRFTPAYLAEAERAILQENASELQPLLPRLVPARTLSALAPQDARAFLASVKSAVLLGVDFKKDPTVVHAAYNDVAAAAFNKGLLAQLNDGAAADFDPASFAHYAFYAPAQARIEMHLVSLARQRVCVAGHAFVFEQGESLSTQTAYFYGEDEIVTLARAAGLQVHRCFVDEERRAGLMYLTPIRGRLSLAMS